MVPNDTRFSTASLGFLLDKMAMFLAVAGTYFAHSYVSGLELTNNYIPVIISQFITRVWLCWLRGSLFPSCAC